MLVVEFTQVLGGSAASIGGCEQTYYVHVLVPSGPGLMVGGMKTLGKPCHAQLSSSTYVSTHLEILRIVYHVIIHVHVPCLPVANQLALLESFKVILTIAHSPSQSARRVCPLLLLTDLVTCWLYVWYNDFAPHRL